MLYLLLELLAAFRRQHPGIVVEVSENRSWWTCRAARPMWPCEWRAKCRSTWWAGNLGMTMRVYAQARRGALAAKHPAHRAPVPRLPLVRLRRQPSRFYDRWMHENIPPQQVVMRIDPLHPRGGPWPARARWPCVHFHRGHPSPTWCRCPSRLREVSTVRMMLTTPDLRQTARVRASFLQEVGVAISVRLAVLQPGGE